MSYYDRLHPWSLVRLLPRMQRVVVSRFRKRNEAEEHLKILQKVTPDASYIIVFDVPDGSLGAQTSDGAIREWMQSRD